MNYQSKLDLLETQVAIKLVKDNFEKKLAENLGLTRVSAPLMVYSNTGLNDNLNGIEKPIVFDSVDLEGDIEIVHSLAKWKRMALKQYGLKRFKGIYTDMNAIRKDEHLDNIHSIYVDQWDWEKVIENNDRTLDFLKGTVNRIMKALNETQDILCSAYPDLERKINQDKVYFITSQELLDLYPNLTSKERENAITREKGCVFIAKIGGSLSNGLPHDGRAPDYDDWELNGDLLIYYDLLDQAIELSSMGIRVNKESLLHQLEKKDCLNRINLPYHSALINDQLPLTMGGGIGQSRLCMVLLNKAHIGEVQASLWPEKMINDCLENNITLL